MYLRKLTDMNPDSNNNIEKKKPSILDFGEPEKENSIIKVIGVGGGGGNAEIGRASCRERV